MAFQNDPGVYALKVDRATPVKITEDSAGRGLLAVEVDNDITNPIPVQVVEGMVGIQINPFNAIDDVPPDIETEILLYTVPVGKSLSLSEVEGSGENRGTYTLYLNGVPLARQRTWWGKFNMHMPFSGYKALANDEISLTILHTSDSDAPFDGRIIGALQDD